MAGGLCKRRWSRERPNNSLSMYIVETPVNSRRRTLLEMEGSRVCPALGSAGGAAVLSRFGVGVLASFHVCAVGQKRMLFLRYLESNNLRN